MYYQFAEFVDMIDVECFVKAAGNWTGPDYCPARCALCTKFYFAGVDVLVFNDDFALKGHLLEEHTYEEVERFYLEH